MMVAEKSRPLSQNRSHRAPRFLISMLAFACLFAVSGALALEQPIWSNFQPPTWVRTNLVTCQVQVDYAAGLDDIAEYRYTTTGNIAVAPWITTNLDVSGTLPTTKTVRVTDLNLPDSIDDNLIQFRIKTLGGPFAESPTYTVLVDSTPPQNPSQVSSSSHTISRWSSDRTIDMQWSGASDATSGLFGYSYVWDTSASTLPPEISNTTGNQATSQPLADGNSYWFHIRTRDQARNWSPDAVHRGPYYIDATPPTNPTSLSSPSHQVGTWSKDNTIEVTWNAGADALSGVGGYSIVWNNQSDTLPDTVTETLALSNVSPAMPDSAEIWFHLRTADRAGNWTSGALHLGPFRVDATPPQNPTLHSSVPPNTWTNQRTIAVSWEGASDSGSGVAGYSYQWDKQPATIPPETIRTTGTESTSPQLSHNEQWYFHLRTADHSGNWSAAVHLGPFLIDLQPPTSPSIFTTIPQGWTRVDNFTVQWELNPIDTSGIGGAFLKLDTPPVSNTDYYTYALGEDIHAITNISVGNDGLHNVYVWLQDRAGNSDYRTAATVPVDKALRLDTVAPASTYRLSRSPDCASGGWYTATVTVNLTASDPVPAGVNAVSGVSVISYTIDGGPVTTLSETGFAVSGEGEHVVRYWAVDNARNREITQTISPRIKIDLHPPVSGVSQISPVGGEPGAAGWFKTPAQVVLAATDSASGVASIWYRYRNGDGPWSSWAQGTSFILDAEGRYSIQHYAVDVACRRESPRDMEGSVDIDLSAPVTTYSVDGTAGRNGWYVSSPIYITLVPTDTTSGVQETKYRLSGETTWRTWTGTPILLSGEGLRTIEYYSVDRAGNREETRQAQIGIDITAPPLPGLPQVSPVGWTNRNDFTLSWTNPFDTSGVAGAYYKLDDEPLSGSDYTGLCTATHVITHCLGIQVPEGRHGVYVWLVDIAGNADYTTRKYRPNLMSYDRVAPRTQITVTGVQSGIWYRSPVTMTFTATDPIPPGVNEVSGVRVISYSVGCGTVWQAGNQVVVSTEGRTTVCYRATDYAGNVEEIHGKTVIIDRNPPLPPSTVGVAPSDWTATNLFTISWQQAPDAAGAYYAFALPLSAADGMLVPGSTTCFGTCSAEITVPAEGSWDLYFWFEDAAGNNGWNAPYYRADAFRHDITPPITMLTMNGLMGREGWYTSPVQVTLTAEDVLSGVAQTSYRLRTPDMIWQPWTTYAGPVTLSQNGATTIRYRSVDEAGNQETYQEAQLKIDTRPPIVDVAPLPAETDAPTPNVNFPVAWSGSDPAPGSGLYAFGVQSKDGVKGEWVTWQQGTSETSAAFAAQPGHVYHFRARASDIAGNVSGWSGSTVAGSTRTYVQSVVNGGFGTAGFAGWQAGGELWARQVMATSHQNTQELMALLGRPELGGGHTANIPIGAGVIEQEITIPPLDDYRDPSLSFWYRVISYDVVYGSDQRLFDSLDVYIIRAGQEPIRILRDGNLGPRADGYDTGWKLATVSLAPYAGQTIRLRFENSNRNDNYYNTWSYVDQVRVTGQLQEHRSYQVELPLISRAP